MSLETSGRPTLLLTMLKQHTWVVASTTIMNKQKRLQTPFFSRKWNDTLLSQQNNEIRYLWFAILRTCPHGWASPATRGQMFAPQYSALPLPSTPSPLPQHVQNLPAQTLLQPAESLARPVQWHEILSHITIVSITILTIISTPTWQTSVTGISIYKVTNPSKSSRNLDLSFSLHTWSSIRTVLCNHAIEIYK